MALARDRPTPAGRRVENPNVWDAHGEIVVEAVLELRKGIFRRKNFDTNVRGLCKYLLVGFRQWVHAHIGDSEAPLRDVPPLFREGGEPQLPPPIAKPCE